MFLVQYKDAFHHASVSLSRPRQKVRISKEKEEICTTLIALCLLISASPPEAAEQFASKVIDKMRERQLSLSLKQLTQLAECSPNRPSQFDELCIPFLLIQMSAYFYLSNMGKVKNQLLYLLDRQKLSTVLTNTSRPPF